MIQSGPLLGEWLSNLSQSIIPFVVLLTGVFVGIVVGRLSRRILTTAGIPDSVEGTPFERTVQRLGTSTVGILSALMGLFVVLLAVVLALSLFGVLDARTYLIFLPEYLPHVFIAALVLIIGLVIADKSEVEVRERFESVKFPEVNLIPLLVKYSILFIATLIALAELGVRTGPLLVVLGGYFFALVVLGALSLKDLLAAGAAGLFLILTQPYSIGDMIEVNGHRGIVQEVGLFITTIENDTEEFILPNHLMLRSGVVRIRS